MTAETQEMDEGKEINFRVTSKGEQQTQCLAFIASKNSGDKASAEWTVDLSNLTVKEDVKLTFNAEGAGLKTKEVDIPMGMKGWAFFIADDDLPIFDTSFAVFDSESEDSEPVYTGVIDENGNANVPFERSDNHTIEFIDGDSNG